MKAYFYMTFKVELITSSFARMDNCVCVTFTQKEFCNSFSLLPFSHMENNFKLQKNSEVEKEGQRRIYHFEWGCIWLQSSGDLCQEFHQTQSIETKYSVRGTSLPYFLTSPEHIHWCGYVVAKKQNTLELQLSASAWTMPFYCF